MEKEENIEKTNENSINENQNFQYPDFQYSDSFTFPHVLTDQILNTDGSEISRKTLKK